MSKETPIIRRWFQFRLRTLLIAILAFSFPLSWLAVRLERARKQKPAILAIERAGGAVMSDWELNFAPTAPPLLTRCFGREFTEVSLVTFCIQDFDPTVLIHLKEIHNLPTLILEWSSIDDEGLQYLEGLESLRELRLGHTSVTDKGLVHLAKLPNLEHLIIQGTPITDAGLKCLETAPHLKHLDLREAKGVSKEAVERFRSAKPNCEVLADEPETELSEPVFQFPPLP